MASSPLIPSLLLQAYPELLLAISCFLFFFIVNLKNRTGRGLPVRLPLVGHVPHYLIHLYDFHDWLTGILRASGCTFLFVPLAGSRFDVLLTCDPANVNHVFNTNFHNYPKGEDFAELFDFLGTGIFNSDNDSWKFQRKKAHFLMSSPKFRAFLVEASKAKVEQDLVPLLDQLAETEGKIIDLADVFLRFSFDNTCMLVFGIDPGSLSVEFPIVPFAKAMDDAEEAVFVRQIVPITCWKILRWLRMGPEKKMAEAKEVLDHVVGRYISRRREEKRSTADLLSAYLDSESEVAENGFDDFDRFLRDTALNLMVAGRDTTSSALTWFFYLVAKHPEVEAKILAEVRRHKFSDFGSLTYLHAALCESLRLYPPVPFEHKAAVKPDTLPSGHKVHEDRRVLFSMYSMARMEGVWGEDCSEFRPERWMSETGKIRHEPSYKFFAFNAGPRSCLGKEIAFTQLKAVAAAVIGRYRVRVAEGFVARPKLSIILHMEGGLKVTVSRREE